MKNLRQTNVKRHREKLHFSRDDRNEIWLSDRWDVLFFDETWQGSWVNVKVTDPVQAERAIKTFAHAVGLRYHILGISNDLTIAGIYKALKF